MRLGQRIKAQREKKGWSQHELARQSGIPQATISRLESGDIKDIQTALARRLARALGVGIDHLVGTFEDDEDAACAAVTGVT
jgi:transcriptional regulator with XRE-family HTH domain